MPTDTKRTKMVHFYTPAEGDNRVEFMRENLRTYENGDTLPVPADERRVARLMADIAASPVPGGPVTVTTYADLAVLVAACSDVFLAEDEAADAALAAQQAENPGI